VRPDEDPGNNSKITAVILGTLGCLGLIALAGSLLFVPFLVVLIASVIAGDETNNASPTCGAPTVESTENTNTVNVPEEYQNLIKDASKEAGTPEQIIAAQIQAESNFNPDASSGVAHGIAQFTDETWAIYGNGGNVNDPKDAIPALGRYMKKLKEIVEPQAKGDADQLIRLTIAAYNAGPGNVQKYGGIPPFSETRDYVEKIMGASQMKFSAGCKAVGWDGDLGPGEWTNPLPKGQFTSGFGGRNVPGLPSWAQQHVGVDLATGSGYGTQGTVIAPTDLTITGLYEKDGCLFDTLNIMSNAAKIGYARVSTADQSEELQTQALERAGCYQIYTDHGRTGRTMARPQLEAALKIALLYLRHNLTEELVADLFEVSQPTISRTIHHIENALLKLKELKAPALESLQNIPGSTGHRRHFDSSVELVFTRENIVFR